MRVIAGEFRSRKLKTVPGLAVRPTPDRLREALFSVLAPRIEGAVFLDAYAGSGAVGIEALSRGARRAILIEKKQAPLEVIRENLVALGLMQRATVLRGEAKTLVGQHPADIAFVDPPYDLEEEYTLSLLGLSAVRCPLVIAQHPTLMTLAEEYGTLRKTRVMRQGDNSLSFFAPLADAHANHPE